MKKYLYLYIFIVFLPLPVFSQAMVKDTIKWKNYIIVVQLPKVAHKHANIYNYEEGFFKTYPFYSYCNANITIHCGNSVKRPILSLPTSSLILSKKKKYKNSYSFIHKNKYYREDVYINCDITIIAENVPLQYRKKIDQAINSIVIVQCISKRTPKNTSCNEN